MTDQNAKPLKVMTYNLENFFVFMDKYKDQAIETMDEFTWQHLPAGILLNKSLDYVKKIAFIIQKHDPDVMMLVEIGGAESLDNFNRHFLGDKYEIFHLPSNSDRGIDLGYLVKKEIISKQKHPPKIISHKKRSLNFLYPNEIKQGKKLNEKTSHRFSRDVLELNLEIYDQQIIFLLVHLKSKLDKNRIDPMGYLRRQAECQLLLKIYRELLAKSQNIIIAGDFNGNAQKSNPDVEFEQIYKTSDLVDLLELQCTSEDMRFTHLFVKRTGQIYANQIDYMFISPTLAPAITKGYVDHYQDFLNAEANPENLKNKKAQLPSDHFPLIGEFLL